MYIKNGRSTNGNHEVGIIFFPDNFSVRFDHLVVFHSLYLSGKDRVISRCATLTMTKKRKKRQAPQDFVKKKKKVGKEKKKGESLTFKSKTVVVPYQLEKNLGPTTYRKQNFEVMLISNIKFYLHKLGLFAM